jgi:exonuclease VII small subunit
MSRYADIADRLNDIVAELDELSLDVLHEAMAEGATKRPDSDKVLTQARRAVEKAASLLERLDEKADHAPD